MKTLPSDDIVETDEVDQKATFNDLLERVGQHQDKEAFATLFGYYAPRIKSFLLGGGMSEGKAEEIMQETFVIVWRKAKGFDKSKAAASTWMFTIARNKKIDLLRKEKRQRIDPNDYLALQPDQKVDVEDIQDKDNAQIIQKVLKELPKKQSELVLLSYYKDKTHVEIAQELNIPLGTVKSRLRLAMDKLRRALEQNGIERP